MTERLYGFKAIEYAKAHGVRVSKHDSTMDPVRHGLMEAEAVRSPAATRS
jgi:hypothetical protein